jgi:hypothetical protein
MFVAIKGVRMTLEDEVTEIMDKAIQIAPSVLRGAVGEGPLDPYNIRDVMDLIVGITNGHREAVRRLAREIQES